MQRFPVCLVALLALGAQSLEAQQRCRQSSCEREGIRVSVERVRAQPARANPAPELGLRGGYDFDEEVAGAGAQLRVPLTREIHVIPSGDVFLNDAATQWQLNADAVFRPAALGGVYGGAGLGVASRDFDADGERETRSGLNLLVGLDGGWFGPAAVRPFVEGRWSRIDEYRPFRMVAGVNVPIRR